MLSACSAVVEFEPSINICTCAGWPGAQVAGEVRRNLQSHISAAFANLARELLDVLHFADNPKRFRIDEAIEKLPALDRAILIQDRHRHVPHIVVERVTERDHLDERRKEHEEKRHRIPQDRDELLEENGAEAAEGCALHRINLTGANRGNEISEEDLCCFC